MRGQLIERGKNTWLLRVYMGEVGGKRRYQSRTVHGGKKEAERALRDWVREIEAGAYVEPAKLTVGELLDRWLRDWAKENVGPTSYARYDTVARLHLKPALGHLPLRKLNALVIQDFYAAKKQELAPATLRLIHVVLHEALAAAVRWKLIAANPAVGIDLPRVERQEVRALSAEEARRLLAAAEGTRLYVPVLLGLSTGMRRGEICALKWEDIDFGKGTLSIRHTLARTPERGLFLKAAKTRASVRLVELSTEVLRALRARKAVQNEERLAAGPAWQDWGLVFCREDGRPVAPSELNVRLQALLRRAGLPALSSHKAWRHTAASLMLAQGVHPKVVQERLGHASISLTLDLYSHLAPGMQREAAERVESLLLGNPHTSRTQAGRFNNGKPRQY